LNGDADLNEYVVFGFGFADDVELFDAEGEAAGYGLEGPADEGGAFAYEAFELSFRCCGGWVWERYTGERGARNSDRFRRASGKIQL
jgi:hypothetical protein